MSLHGLILVVWNFDNIDLAVKGSATSLLLVVGLGKHPRAFALNVSSVKGVG